MELHQYCTVAAPFSRHPLSCPSGHWQLRPALPPPPPAPAASAPPEASPAAQAPLNPRGVCRLSRYPATPRCDAACGSVLGCLRSPALVLGHGPIGERHLRRHSGCQVQQQHRQVGGGTGPSTAAGARRARGSKLGPCELLRQHARACDHHMAQVCHHVSSKPKGGDQRTWIAVLDPAGARPQPWRVLLAQSWVLYTLYMPLLPTPLQRVKQRYQGQRVNGLGVSKLELRPVDMM